jgi:hypothetical protein
MTFLLEFSDLSETPIKKFHFLPKHDVWLLRQAVADQPFFAPRGRAVDAWDALAKTLRDKNNLAIEGRSVRERFSLLVAKYKKDEMASLRKSGTEEHYGEREQLLREVLDVMNEASVDAAQAKEKKEASIALGKKLRESAMLTLKNKRNNVDSDSPTTADPSDGVDSQHDSKVATKGRKLTLASIFQDRSKLLCAQQETDRIRADNETKRLKLDEDRLQFEEKKFDFERARLEADVASRRAQDQLILALVKKITPEHGVPDS